MDVCIGNYDRTRRGLGYVLDSTTSESDSDESVYHDHSSIMSSWGSDISVKAVFRALFINIVSTCHPEEDVDYGLLQSEDDPYIKHFNALCDSHFEKCELPTEDTLIQVNLRSEANLKPIFISESLLPFERGDMVLLIHKYIDVFA